MAKHKKKDRGERRKELVHDLSVTPNNNSFSDRRKFLKWGAGIVVLLGTGLGGYTYFHSDSDKWAFLEAQPLAYRGVDPEEVVSRYSPVGPLRTIVTGTQAHKKLQEITDVVMQEVEGFDPTKMGVRGTLQWYAIPEEERVLEGYKDYYISVVALLQREISGLNKPNLDFVLISERSDHSTGYVKKIFLANSFYDVLRPEIYDLSTGETLQPLPLGITPFIGGQTYQQANGFTLGGVGPFGLTIPYSEWLPETFSRVQPILQGAIDIDTAVQIEEAIEEGISHLFMRQNKLGAPHTDKLIPRIRSGESENSRYNYLDKSMQLMQNSGIQTIVGIYLREPLTFFNMLRN